MVLQQAMVSSKTNEWETPQYLFDALNKEFKFTLDPCCRKDTAKCNKFFTVKEDGLKQSWNKETVFMNPPYGGHTGDWIKKAYNESLEGAIVVCLIVSSTDRSYWHDYIYPFATQIRFIRGRIKFGDAESTAPFASAIIVFDTTKQYYHKIVCYKESISTSLKKSKQNENNLEVNATTSTTKDVGIFASFL